MSDYNSPLKREQKEAVLQKCKPLQGWGIKEHIRHNTISSSLECGLWVRLSVLPWGWNVQIFYPIVVGATGCHLSYFSLCYSKILWQKQLTGEGVCFGLQLKIESQQPEAAAILYLYLRSRERWALVFSSLSPIYSVRTTACGMVPPAFRLSTPVSPIKIILSGMLRGQSPRLL